MYSKDIDTHRLGLSKGLSILTPTLNCAETISETLVSVTKLRNFLGENRLQHLFGDAGSTDGTITHIQRYLKSETNVTLVATTGMNIPSTLNELMIQVRMSHVLVLNGDDCLIPESLAGHLEMIMEGDSVFSFNALVRSKCGRVVGERISVPGKIDRYMSINHAGLIVPTSYYIRNSFDVRFQENYDYIWCWSNLRTKQINHINEHAAIIRLGGISEKRAVIAAFQICFVKIENGYYSASLTLIGTMMKLYSRKFIPKAVLDPIIRSYRKIVGSGDILY